MRKALLTLAAVGVVALLLAAWVAWWPRHAPPGQPALVALNAGNFAEFKRSFNDVQDGVRVVLLFSPT